MNEHEIKLWKRMVDLIDSYLAEETEDFYSVVGELEGALDASEIRDSDLLEQWYIHWSPLEIRRAIEGNEVNKEKALLELQVMKLFLTSNLPENY